jgi:DNA-directed RNA polymerase subunit M/transcription elongation factor TFIIS
VGETTRFNLKCKSCDHKNEVEINLDEVEVQGEVKKNEKVALTDSVGVVLRYPTVKGIQKQLGKQGGDQSEVTMAAVASAIESIYDAENVYPTEDEKAEDVISFLDSLTSSQFKKISEYFEDMPRLKHEVNFNCKSCKEENSQTLEGLTNFF